jgi:hypothetical protein
MAMTDATVRTTAAVAAARSPAGLVQVAPGCEAEARHKLSAPRGLLIAIVVCSVFWLGVAATVLALRS